jgi:hypothetical protein
MEPQADNIFSPDNSTTIQPDSRGYPDIDHILVDMQHEPRYRLFLASE